MYSSGVIPFPIGFGFLLFTTAPWYLLLHSFFSCIHSSYGRPCDNSCSYEAYTGLRPAAVMWDLSHTCHTLTSHTGRLCRDLSGPGVLDAVHAHTAACLVSYFYTHTTHAVNPRCLNTVPGGLACTGWNTCLLFTACTPAACSSSTPLLCHLRWMFLATGVARGFAVKPTPTPHRGGGRSPGVGQLLHVQIIQPLPGFRQCTHTSGSRHYAFAGTLILPQRKRTSPHKKKDCFYRILFRDHFILYRPLFGES